MTPVRASHRIYTSGIISDSTKFESLEQLQDNKLALVCEKLDLNPSDRLLDIGCGWGTLAAYAGKNYGCDVTGGTSLMSIDIGLIDVRLILYRLS
jgi:cyclopropane fatty-acyl-phospholipid synthase-like methyltransferase